MSQKELSELKRRLNPEKRNPSVIRGCYMTAQGERLAAFAKPVYSLPLEENEKYMSIFKKVLSGSFGLLFGFLCMPAEYCRKEFSRAKKRYILLLHCMRALS